MRAANAAGLITVGLKMNCIKSSFVKTSISEVDIGHETERDIILVSSRFSHVVLQGLLLHKMVWNFETLSIKFEDFEGLDANQSKPSIIFSFYLFEFKWTFILGQGLEMSHRSKFGSGDVSGNTWLKTTMGNKNKGLGTCYSIPTSKPPIVKIYEVGS